MESFHGLFDEEVNHKIQEKILEAQALPNCRKLVPSVFVALKLDGSHHVGVNYQEAGTKPGTVFDYDFAVVTKTRNEDAVVVWIRESLEA